VHAHAHLQDYLLRPAAPHGAVERPHLALQRQRAAVRLLPRLLRAARQGNQRLQLFAECSHFFPLPSVLPRCPLLFGHAANHTEGEK
jgi:hypothetical protein